jgi:serine/threonine protein kinase
MSGVLHGLHAAHQAKTEQGKPLCIVHRDVSPQNIIVGPDGIARILDFGIAKAAGQSSLTTGDQIKGKLSYMAPEQLGARALAGVGTSGSGVTVRTDVFAAAIVLWEALVGRRLFLDESEAKTLDNLLSMPIQPPSAFVPGLSFALDAVVLRGLERDPDKRFASARDMALALEQAAPPASPAEVGAWVQELAHEGLSTRAAMLQEVESAFASDPTSLADRLSVDSSQSVAPFVGSAAGNKTRALVAAPVVLIGLCLGSIALALHARAGSAPTPANAGEPSAGDNAGVPPASSEDPPDPAASSASLRQAAPGGFLGPTRPTRTRQRPPRTASSGAREAAPSFHCAPPYTFDSVGHKVFKPECF